jgi:LysM repeat protein
MLPTHPARRERFRRIIPLHQEAFMKLATLLALLVAVTPLSWSAEFNQDEAGPPPVEAPSAEPVQASAPSKADAVETSPSTTNVTVVSPETVPATTVTPVAQETPSEPPVVVAPSGASHRVVKGDTLWDLAGSYLKNPYLWPKIVEANKGRIENPDLIFPDQDFIIPSVEAAENMAAAPVPETPAETPAETSAVSPEVVPEAVAAVPEPESDVKAPDQAEDMDAAPAPAKKKVESVEEMAEAAPELGADETSDEREAKRKNKQAVPGAGFMGGMADSFVADENWEYDGYVLRDRDQRMMISQGDVVFLNIGAASGVKPKMSAHVYRVGKRVQDPFLKKKTGRMVKRVGTVIVTGQITEEGCTAVVTNSLEPIRVGDIVKFASR